MSAEVLRSAIEADTNADILDRFIAVSGRVVRKEEEERENIRKQLALEREDLQICFVNEIASDEDGLEDGGDGLEDGEVEEIGKEIVKCNISQKAGQIIVPVYSPDQENGHHSRLSDSSQQTFRRRVECLQEEARRGLLHARTEARLELERARKERVLSPQLTRLVGIEPRHRLTRRILSNLSVGQLHVILNHFLGEDRSINIRFPLLYYSL